MIAIVNGQPRQIYYCDSAGIIRQVYTLGERIWAWCPICMCREWHIWDGKELRCTNHTNVEKEQSDE